MERTLAVMQPYIFPYIGYFHLIHASDTFVFYDDVQYIKGGWINRNRIAGKPGEIRFTVPLRKASSNKRIDEIEVGIDARWLASFQKTVGLTYGKSPYYKEVSEMVMSVLSRPHHSISELAIDSVASVHEYLGVPFNVITSSSCCAETKGLERTERLLSMCRQFECTRYVNAPGGKKLYKTGDFESKGVQLYFVRSERIEYPRSTLEFVPGLSIIDILMYCSKRRTVDMFGRYALE